MTWTTYGTWLPGDARGSFVDDRRDGPGRSGPKPRLETAARELLRHEPVILSDDARAVVDDSLRQHAGHRGWNLLALNVRTNHVHLAAVIERDPDKAMGEFKARATRRLRETGLFGRDITVWTQHGSTRHLNSSESRFRAVRYVMECQ